MEPTPLQIFEAELRVEAKMGQSTWGRRCAPLTPCESERCGREACKGLTKARKRLQARARYAYKTRVAA